MPNSGTAVAAAVSSSDLPSPSRWVAVVGLGLVVLMLVACFGVLIASSHSASASEQPASVATH